MNTIAIVGTVGIPASYGGFETLAENLASFHQTGQLPGKIVVYCSAKAYPDRAASYLGAKLRYVRLDANGVASILYDMVCLFSAAVRRSDIILFLGVSGAVALPILRFCSSTRLVTNIDGLEWKRAKWNGPAHWFLRFSERLAVRFSHEVISDNAAIAQYVSDTYGRNCQVIAYGGDHAVSMPVRPFDGQPLPNYYALALCRIEPENNVDMILKAFSRQRSMPLVFIGNWRKSAYGSELHRRYSAFSHLHLLDPIYDLGVLRGLRDRATFYIHGHSAGGTNPSLVEMMHFGKSILAFDCIFNRYTTDGKAFYFRDENELQNLIAVLDPDLTEQSGKEMLRIAQDQYTWDNIGKAYFKLLQVF